MRLNRRAVLMICAVLLAPAVARAGNCTCTGATLNAGAYSVFQSSASQPQVALAVTCNGNASYNIALSTGNSGTYASRSLNQTASSILTYNIFIDAARLIVWAGTNQKVYSASGTVTFTEPLYLKIDPLQDVAFSGSLYSDNIVATMTPNGSTGGPTTTCSFSIQASVTAECVAPGSTLSFGNYDPVAVNATAGSPLDAAATLNVQCTKGVSATIGLDNGANASAGVRRMAGPSANFLNYDIFIDSARTLRWTTLAGGTVTATSTSKDATLGGAGGLLAYGRIPGAQDVVTGAYSDSVTATVNY
ncbi:MAG: hypothetical protein NVSMB68_11060 [Thermoanaerobaculia bacterium]